MRRIVIFALTLSMLTISIDCAAQFYRQGEKMLKAMRGKGVPAAAIVGKGAYDTYTSMRTVRQLVPNVAGQYGYRNRIAPTLIVPPDSLSKLKLGIKVSDIKKLPTPMELEELRRFRQEAKLQKAKKQLRKEYQKLCTEVEQGTLRDTLALVRIGDKAVELKCDSIAVGCFMKFISSRPSTQKMVTAVDSLMKSSQVIAPPLIDEDIEYKFCKYWESPDSAKIGVSDFEVLAKLGNKYPMKCRKTEVAQGMLPYFDCDYDSASYCFERTTRNVLLRPEEYDPYGNYLGKFYYNDSILLRPENDLLFSVTALCMDQAQRYSDMLLLFGDEGLDQYMAESPYMAFLLYKASLFANPDKTQKYWKMGMAANEEYFTEQFRELYDAIYADFIENPQLLTNLDFLTVGLDSCQLSQSYMDMACDLIGKLPDMNTSYDGVEHYYDESFIPYREALLEVARRSDSLYNYRFTPENVLMKIFAESTSAGFLSSVERAKANIKTLFEQLYKKRDDPEYYVTIVLSGYDYSELLSYQQPKEALKIMNEAVLPIMKKLDTQDVNLFGDEGAVEIYKYMAALYRRIGKQKKAEKMCKLADEYVIAVE